MYTVYQHKNKINGKVYIGITKQAPEERWNNGKKYKSSPHFYAAIQKYGWDNFEHNILFQNLTKEEACQKEQKLIQKLSEMAKKDTLLAPNKLERTYERLHIKNLFTVKN